MTKFLKSLEAELKKLKLSDEEIKEIIADHQQMLNEAKEEGLSEEEITAKFGDPEKLARDLAEDVRTATLNMNDYSNEQPYDAIDGYELHQALLPTDELTEINISLVSEDLSIYPYEGEKIEIHFRKINKPEDFDISLENGVFKLKRKQGSKLFNFGSRDSGKIVVRYPRDQKLTTYQIVEVSGDVKAKGIQTDVLNLKSTSGDYHVEGVEAGKTEFKTVSGDFNLLDLRLGETIMSAVSGDYEGKNIVVAGELTLNTVSGDFEFDNVKAKSASLRTVSGDLEATEFYVEVIDLRSVSGDIEIENQDKTKPIKEGHKKSVSGKIEIR